MEKVLSLAHSAAGNVISTLGIIIALVAGWNDMTSAIATHAAQIKSQQTLIEQHTAELRQLRHEIKADLARLGEEIHRHDRRAAKKDRESKIYNRNQWNRNPWD